MASERWGERPTMLTYEEWWKTEGHRRRLRPYTAETQYHVKRGTCRHNERRVEYYQACAQCRQLEVGAIYDKVTIQRIDYE
jgi:hypothetical protein